MNPEPIVVAMLALGAAYQRDRDKYESILEEMRLMAERPDPA